MAKCRRQEDERAIAAKGRQLTRSSTPISPKLDAARIERGKPPITKVYVTVHVRYTTDRQGNRHAYEEGMLLACPNGITSPSGDEIKLSIHHRARP